MPLHVADGSVGHDAAHVDLYLAAEVICDADLHYCNGNHWHRRCE